MNEQDPLSVWSGFELSRLPPSHMQTKLALPKIKSAFYSGEPTRLGEALKEFPGYARKNKDVITSLLADDFNQEMSDVLVSSSAFCGKTFLEKFYENSRHFAALSWALSSQGAIKILEEDGGNSDRCFFPEGTREFRTIAHIIPSLISEKNALPAKLLREFFKQVDWPFLLRGGYVPNRPSSIALSCLTSRIAKESIGSVGGMSKMCDRFLDDDIIVSLYPNREVDISMARALQMNAFRDAFLLTDSSGASRLQEVINISPRLSSCWSDYWDIPVDHEDLSPSKRVKDPARISSQHNDFGIRSSSSLSWLDDMISMAHPVIMDTLSGAEFSKQPIGLSKVICSRFRSNPVVLAAMLNQSSLKGLVPILPKLGTWLENFTTDGANVVHMAAVSHFNPQVLISSAKALTNEPLVYKKNFAGKSPLDLMLASGRIITEEDMNQIDANLAFVRKEKLSESLVLKAPKPASQPKF